MLAQIQSWMSRALWSMLFIALIWVIYVLASHYGSCRADGTGKFVCLLVALMFGWLDVLVLVIAAAARVLETILP